MTTDLPTLDQLQPAGKRVIVRVDFNVPLDKATGEISDATRIEKSLPTLQHLIRQGASVVIVSHMGRPGRKDLSLSLEKVAAKLGELLGSTVDFIADSPSEASVKASRNLQEGQVLLLENIRFNSQETSKEKADRQKLATLLAKHGDAYVDDAFGACHRAHASIVELAEALPAYAGLLLQKEIEVLDKLLSRPAKPFVAVIGGAKVSSKIAVLEKLIPKVDTILIGGAMAYTFLKSRLVEIGNSMVERDFLSKAFQLIDKADYNQTEFLLPEDHIVAKEFSESAKTKTVKVIPDGFMGMDIGPKTADKYARVLKNAATVLWNGPMGVFEMDAFSKGTVKLAKAMAKVKGTTVVGGGDSVYAVKKAGVEDQMTHISTGGGATLEYLEGKKLPGIVALQKE